MRKSGKYGLTVFDWSLIVGVCVCSLGYAIVDSDTSGFDYLGVIAAISGLFCVVLVAHRKKANYFFGLINVTLYAYISYKSNLLGDCLLNAGYYLPMQIAGWLSWSRNPAREDRTVVRSYRLSTKQRVVLTTISLAAVALFGYLLYFLKSNIQEYPFIERWHLYSEYPFKDALTTIFAIVAQYLMVKAYSEQWFFWMTINVVSIIIWSSFVLNGVAHSGLMVIMYVFYLANSINGARLWRSRSTRP